MFCYYVDFSVVSPTLGHSFLCAKLLFRCSWFLTFLKDFTSHEKKIRSFGVVCFAPPTCFRGKPSFTLHIITSRKSSMGICLLYYEKSIKIKLRKKSRLTRFLTIYYPMGKIFIKRFSHFSLRCCENWKGLIQRKIPEISIEPFWHQQATLQSVEYFIDPVSKIRFNFKPV